MINLKEIEDQLDEWEEEANEKVEQEAKTGAFNSMDEAAQAIIEHVQEHHREEIEKRITQLEGRQDQLGSDYDEYTPESQKEDDQQEHDAIEELLDRLRRYTD